MSARRPPTFIQFKQIGKKIIKSTNGKLVQNRVGGLAVWTAIFKSISKVVSLKTINLSSQFDALSNLSIFCSLLSRSSPKLAAFLTEEEEKCVLLGDRRDKCSTTINHSLKHWYNGVECTDRASCMRAIFDKHEDENVFFIHFVYYRCTRELTWHACFECLTQAAEVTCNHPEWLSLSSAIDLTNTPFPPQLPFTHTGEGKSIFSLFRNYYGVGADPLAEVFASRGKNGISVRSLATVKKDKRLCQPAFTIDYETRQVRVEQQDDINQKSKIISLPYMISFGLSWHKCQQPEVCSRWHKPIEDVFYRLADQEKQKRHLLAKVIKCRVEGGFMRYSTQTWEDFKEANWFSLARNASGSDQTVDEQLAANPNQTLSGVSFYLDPLEEYTAEKSASFIEFVNVLMFDFVHVILEKARIIFDLVLDSARVDSLRLLQITFNGAGYDNVFNISKLLELKQVGEKPNDFNFKSDTFYERGKSLGLYKATHRRALPGRQVGFHVCSIDVLEYTKTSLSNACKEYGILGSKLETVDPGLAEIAYELIDTLPLADGIRNNYSRAGAVAEVCDIFYCPLLYRHTRKHENSLRQISSDVLSGSTNLFDLLAFYNVVDALSTYSLFSVVEKVSNEATEMLCDAYHLPFRFTVDLMKKQTMPSFAVSKWRLLYHLRVLIDANFRLSDPIVKTRSVYPSQGLVSLLTRMNIMGGKTVANVITPPGQFIDHIASVDLASCYATAACAIMPTGQYSVMTSDTLDRLQAFIDSQIMEMRSRIDQEEPRYFPSFANNNLPFFIHLCYIEPSSFSIERYPDFGILMDKLFMPTSNAVKVNDQGLAYLNFENMNLIQSADTNIWSHRARTIFLDAINIENLIYAGFSVKLLKSYKLDDVDASVEEFLGDLGFCCSWTEDVLGPFQKTLSEQRIEAKAKGEAARQAFLKMEGNSTYGKHCEKSFRGKYISVANVQMDGATDYLTHSGHKINFSHKLTGKDNSHILAYTEIFPYDPTVSSPILGVAILSQSRRQLLHLFDKLKGHGATLDPNFAYIYGDTDSVFVPNSSLKNVDPRSWLPGLSPFSVEKNDYDPLHLSLDYSDACVAVFAKKFYCVVEQKKDVEHDQVYAFLDAFRVKSYERASSLASLVNVTIKMAGVPVKQFTSAKKDRIYQDFEQSYCDPLHWLKVFFEPNPTEISWFRLSLKTPGKKIRHAVVDPVTLAEFDFYIERVAQKRKIQRTLDGGVHNEDLNTKIWHTRAPRDSADFAYCLWASRNRHLSWTGDRFVRIIDSPSDIIDLSGGRERPLSAACLYFLAARSYLYSYLPTFGYNGEPAEADEERGQLA
jgi:hypothetical protein